MRRSIRFDKEELKSFLDGKVEQYNRPAFIENDPVSIPHMFSKREDIEIAGFIAATLAWGQRVTIISKCRQLLSLMEDEPHAFIMNHERRDLARFKGFCHRTFNEVDLKFFISSLHHIYRHHDSMEELFIAADGNIETGLVNFHNTFFSIRHPDRTRKHVATPSRGSTCKRLNMFLRWMVRCDRKGVDFGFWQRLQPSQLVCPLDVHVDRVARRFRLIRRKQTDWRAAVELTENLRKLDPTDPVKYDFALFGLGVEGHF